MSATSNVLLLSDFRQAFSGERDGDAWHDLALAQAFVEVGRLAATAAVAVNARIVMSTSAAAARLGAVNHAWLWRRLRNCDAPGSAMLPLHGREPVRADLVPVFVGSARVGILLTLDLSLTTPPDASAVLGESFFASVLPGASPRASKLRAQAARSLALGANTLITGEAGTGKATVARRIAEHVTAPGEPICQFDGHDADESGWLNRIVSDLDQGAVVVTHLDTVLPIGVERVLAVARDSGRGPLIATAGDVSFLESDVTGFGSRIDLPPLRERIEDLPAIAAEVLARASGTAKPKRLAAGVRRQLWGYSWPGNVTELVQILKRASARAPTAFIDESCLCLPGSTSGGLGAQRRSLVDAAELDTLRDALSRCGGNKLAAADMLGISRSTLYRKVRAFGL